MSYLYPFQRSRLSLALFLLFCSHFPFAQAKTVSRIIDDNFGDEVTGYRPVYYPLDPTVWKSNCGKTQGCGTVPDANFVQNRTWTAATYKANMTDMGFGIQFKGTAISVYFIITNQLDSTAITKDTECNFTLDGSDRERYEHKAVSGQSFEYNVSVFDRTGLENGWHMLQVNTGKLDHDTYISFDYARYTYVSTIVSLVFF
ncbi:hypothetical protein L218DRAFT_860945 [Marasmius fiardii PR-910]|nr:hypothetical protein L218DRAFT_860945 [Marasmius fiardii PR-910]